MAEDFRVAYLAEAQNCLRAYGKITEKYPEHWAEIPAFWANLWGAIANATIASVPDEVALGLVEFHAEKERQHAVFRKMIDERLGSA